MKVNKLSLFFFVISSSSRVKVSFPLFYSLEVAFEFQWRNWFSLFCVLFRDAIILVNFVYILHWKYDDFEFFFLSVNWPPTE